ncbi:hypothetical protein INT43_004047 [Umbelopsis isabellina]|uniref:Uncharacterized protein n=1 Tax=Mortierella isabellina TaxID=91625 RepID=A0A8H7PU45_MORIS|nr:hypothetical protein INT43_004047 [Umbelopsis isabellina]
MTSTVPRFLEEFALNDSIESRQKLLNTLVPGSKDSVYYESLVLLQTLDLILQKKNVDLNSIPVSLNQEERQVFEDAKKKITEGSVKNYPEIEQQLKMRFHLLAYPVDPVSTCNYLMQNVGLKNHDLATDDNMLLDTDPANESGDSGKQYLSSLDANHFSDDKIGKLIQNVYFQRLMDGNDCFEAIALPFLYQLPTKSDFEEQTIIRYVLDNAKNTPIRLPDFVKRLSKVIISLEENQKQQVQTINRLDISSLTLAQLDELSEYVPGIMDDANYIELYLSKLQPTSDYFAEAAIDHTISDEVLLCYVDMTLKFLQKVPTGGEEWKRAAMHKKLTLNMFRGVYDEKLFLDYLRMPRRKRSSFMFDERFGYEHRNASVDYWLSFSGQVKPFILDVSEVDEQNLIPEYLSVLFIRGLSKDTFQGILDFQSYLNPIYAEAMFTTGKIQAQDCIAVLGQTRFAALAEQQDFEFTPTSKRSKIWRPEETIEISLRLKNVKDLGIRVFRINMYSYYRKYPKRQRVDHNIDLDGLTPIWETYKTYDERAASERFEETIQFFGRNGVANREFDGRGLWVIDFISGRKSSRALGFVNCILRPTVSGQLLTLTDEENRKLEGPYSVFVAGTELESDAKGNVIIPFSDESEDRQMLFKLQNYAQVEKTSSLVEDYVFDASFYVNHESLQKERIATITVVPLLKIGDQRAPLSLLEDMKLTMQSTDTSGISSSYTLADIKFEENQPCKNEFRVQPDLRSLTFTVEGKVTRCVGEAKRNTTISLELKHKFLTSNIPMMLKTDDNGEIRLGQLSNITHIDLPTVNQRMKIKLDEQVNSWPDSICEAQDTQIQLPFYSGEQYHVGLGKCGVDQILIEDWTSNVCVEDGLLKINDLSPGHYQLRCVLSRHTQNLKLFIIESTKQPPAEQPWTNFRLGKRWTVEAPGISVLRPLTINQVTRETDKVKIQLQNWSSKTYAIVCGTSTISHQKAHEDFMAKIGRRQPLKLPVGQCANNSLFVSGRKLSEEYQYILERARYEKWMGTTLQQPSLLLKRQAQSDTSLANKAEEAAVGFGSSPNKMKKLHSRMCYRRTAPYDDDYYVESFNLTPVHDFLDIQNIETIIIKPDLQGTIIIEHSLLGTTNDLSILVVSGEQAVARDIPLFRQLSIPKVDLRHFSPVDEGKAIVRAREVTKLAATDTPMEAWVGQEREVVDSFEKLFTLFETVSQSEELKSFNFLMTWMKLNYEEKLEIYNQHSCHELNFWLMHKDKPFFKDVVQVALKSKLQKTFLDLYMLESDITAFASDLYKFNQLNLVEKVLLAKRIPDIHGTVERSMAGYLDKHPDESSRLQQQFDTVLAGASMDIEKMSKVEPMAEMMMSAAFPLPPDMPSASTDTIEPGNSYGGQAATTRGASFTASSYSVRSAPPPIANVLQRGESLDNISHQSSKFRNGNQQNYMQEDSAMDLDDEEDKEEDEQEAIMKLRKRITSEFKYQYMERTREYRETNYLCGTSVIIENGFWVDYLRHTTSAPFLSERFMEASDSFTQQIFALAVMDLPFKADAQSSSEFLSESNQIKITASTPALVFHRSLKLCEVSTKEEKLLVVQNIFNASKYSTQQNKRVHVDGENLKTSVEYGMHVVISNMTAEAFVIEVTYQIPIGSVPTRGSKYLDAIPIRIEPFTTWQEETSFFYFPENGQFTNVPVSVTVDGELVARSKLMDLEVKEELPDYKKEDWGTIASRGNQKDIFEYLNSGNLHDIDFSLIYHKMENRLFATEVINILRGRQVYDYTLWCYGIKHNLPLAIRDLMKIEQYHLSLTGRYFKSALVDLPDNYRDSLSLLDYNPIIKARVHTVGEGNVILNRAFYEHYKLFLEYLSQKPIHSAADRLCLAVYLIYQERLREARKLYEELVQSMDAAVAESVQLHYLGAYLNTRVQCDSLENSHHVLESSRDVALKYQDYPVLSWRERFKEIISMFNDLDGTTDDNDNRQLTVEELNVKELNVGPSLELTTTDQEVYVTCSKLNTINLKIYALNIEMLFSTNPFISKNSSGNYSVVAANYEKDYDVNQCPKASVSSEFRSRVASDDFEIIGGIQDHTNNIKLDIPVELQYKNILVEVQGGGLIQSTAHFSNALNVRAVESSGLIRVMSSKSGKPNAGAYVKVYVKLYSGKVHFWKDGYTAINGVFDYVSVTEDNAVLGTDDSSLKQIMTNVQKMSILVLSSDAGGLIKVVEPPK